MVRTAVTQVKDRSKRIETELEIQRGLRQREPVEEVEYDVEKYRELGSQGIKELLEIQRRPHRYEGTLRERGIIPMNVSNVPLREIVGVGTNEEEEKKEEVVPREAEREEEENIFAPNLPTPPRVPTPPTTPREVKKREVIDTYCIRKLLTNALMI